MNADIAMWQLLNSMKITLKDINKTFYENDIIANRIWIKAYASQDREDGCSTQRSYWEKLSKYSANCSLYDIIEEDFSGAVMILGGTHSRNDDTFSVLDVLEADRFTGADLHANTVMTMMHLNGSMRRLSFWKSALIVFVSFFVLSFILSVLFGLMDMNNKEVEFIVLLIIMTVVLFSLSAYLLQVHQRWFNWFVPLVLFEVVEIFDYFREYTPGLFSKILRKEK